MAVERFANSPTPSTPSTPWSTLNGAYTAGGATMTVINAAPFPAAAQFRILVDNQILLVTGVAGNVFSVSATEGSTPANHANGAGVYHVLTAAALTTAFSPGGTDTQVQFNDAGAPGGAAAFRFDKTDTEWRVKIGGGTSVAADAPIDLLLAAPDQSNWQFGLMNSTFSTNPNNGFFGGISDSGAIDFFWQNYAGGIDLATTGTASFAVVNEAHALTFITPAATAVGVDTTPVAAIYINGPVVPSTRNFASGIWVITNGGSLDKGRGIGVQNLGLSDSFYTSLDGAGGAGYNAVLNGAGAVGINVEGRNTGQICVHVSQGTGGGTANLLELSADIAGATEMVRVNSTQTSKTGFVFRMAGAGNTALVTKDGGGNNLLALAADTSTVTFGTDVTLARSATGTLAVGGSAANGVNLTLAAGGTSRASLTFPASTLTTTAGDGDMEMDANCFYLCTDAGNRGYVPVVNMIRQHADRAAFANNTNQQAIFDSVTNGTLTLETGTYEFEGVIQIKAMSATSGNLKFSLAGAGGATLANILYVAMAYDAANDTLTATSGLSEIISTQTAVDIATATTATVCSFYVKGSFELTVAGTIIPSVAQTTATTTAVTTAGSFMKFNRIGATTAVSVGQWT